MKSLIGRFSIFVLYVLGKRFPGGGIVVMGYRSASLIDVALLIMRKLIAISDL